MSSESKSGGPSEPPEKEAPRRRVPPYDPDPALITYWEAGDKRERGFRAWWRHLFGISNKEPECF
jgi:hypothetical protein